MKKKNFQSIESDLFNSDSEEEECDIKKFVNEQLKDNDLPC